MRLLNTTSQMLEEFLEDSSKLSYAILSHTWGKGEISFEDLRNGPTDNVTRKAAYPKLLGACDQAKRDNHDYIWIDTCCIDKSSSAELSEAINSMFKWYEHARICYVYLADCNLAAAGKSADPIDILALLRRARWFTRGWTLQELIAPRRLWLFDQNWVRVGSRRSLARELTEITQIPMWFLYHEFSGGNERKPPSVLLSYISVAARMSWASTRETTRAEDMAYSLLGVFNVHMPLLYGEGASAAFLRLQREVIRSTGDQSILAWGRVPPRPERPERSVTQPFAQSPSDFLHCTNMVNETSVEGIDTSVRLTDAGVEMTVYLASVSLDSNEQRLRSLKFWLVVLECRYMNGNYLDRPAILVRDSNARASKSSASASEPRHPRRLWRVSAGCIRLTQGSRSTFARLESAKDNSTAAHPQHVDDRLIFSSRLSTFIRHLESHDPLSNSCGYETLTDIDPVVKDMGEMKLENVRLESPIVSHGSSILKTVEAFPPLTYSLKCRRSSEEETWNADGAVYSVIQTWPPSDASRDGGSILISGNKPIDEGPLKQALAVQYAGANKWVRIETYGLLWLRENTLPRLSGSAAISDNPDELLISWGLVIPAAWSRTPGEPRWWSLSPWCAIVENDTVEAGFWYRALQERRWADWLPEAPQVRDYWVDEEHHSRGIIGIPRPQVQNPGPDQPAPQSKLGRKHVLGRKADQSKRKNGWQIDCTIDKVTWAARKAFQLQIDFQTVESSEKVDEPISQPASPRDESGYFSEPLRQPSPNIGDLSPGVDDLYFEFASP